MFSVLGFRSRRLENGNWRGEDKNMTHVWCHGPNCHTYSTQDRVRGSKGSKVLRTRKVKIYNGVQLGTSFYNYFCSNGCYNDFAHEHAQQIIKIAPRNEPLETRINDPKKEEHEGWNGYKYTTTKITKLDTSNDVG